MLFLTLLALWFGGEKAMAMEDVIVSAGYNLRIDGDKKSARIKTLRKSVEATLLRTRGSWKQVCIDGVGTVCSGGMKAWVYKDGVRTAPDTPMPTPRRTTECIGGSCARKSTRKTIPEQIEPIAEAIDERGYTLPSDFDARCSTFISAKGLGPWGRAMIGAANRVGPNCFYERNFYGSLCPNFKSLPPAKKNAMIAMTFAAIATTEASCDPKSRNPHGTNDIADGMFQLEYTASFRKEQGRNERWCKTGQVVDTQAIGFQSECAVSTINDSICKKFGSYIFDSRGYWQELKHNREITQRIRRTAQKWRLCQKSDDDD